MGCCGGRAQLVNKESDESYLFLQKQNKTAQLYQTQNVFTNKDQGLRKKQLNDEDPDIKELTYAMETTDLATIISYLNNDKPINKNNQINHPWADDPKSIGSLATAFLASFFM